MPTLHDMLHDSITTRTNALAHTQPSDLPDTTTRITRIRHTRTASAAAVLAVLMAGAAALPLTGTQLFEPPEPTPGDTAYVEIDLAEVNSITTSQGTPVEFCGQPIEAMTESQGFTYEPNVQVQDGPDGIARVDVEEVVLTYSGPTYTDVNVTFSLLVFAKDGVVVGYVDGSTTRPQESIAEGWTQKVVTVQNFRDYLPYMCDGSEIRGENGERLQWEEGTYEAYAITTVRRSASDLAQAELLERGFVLMNTTWGLWQPGSVDCQQTIKQSQRSPGSPMPVQCEPFGVPDVTLDLDKGTATIPYTVPWGPGDLDVVLVSEATAVTYEESYFWPLANEWQPPEWTFTGADGVATTYVEDQSMWSHIRAATDPADLTSLLNPEGIAITFDLNSNRGGTFELPDSMTVLVISNRDEVIGTATATFPDGTTVSQDRAESLGNLRAVLSNYQPDANRDDRLDPYLTDQASISRLLFIGPVSFDLIDKEPTQVDSIEVRFDWDGSFGSAYYLALG